ncbi:hypothetical protein BT93_E0984 [Corymbia citriodora subsp. variegata]|nr:hypothetical protein BT93_E0984 [Corymbia citriodora subsp. variegata]
MVGKGRRRREKNYRAAHGGTSTLPPPPDPSQVDALPSKLRKLISFASSPQPPPPQDAAKDSKDSKTRKKSELGDDKKHSGKGGLDSKATTSEVGGGDGHLTTHWNGNDEISQKNAGKKRKRKGKKGQPEDLRFQAVEESSTGSRRKERKKMYRESRKKKHKKANDKDDMDFPGQEKVKFGDIVEAPPKLAVIPKALKTPQNASQQRLRLQAIEAYRNRRGWASCPGSQLPSTIGSSLSL